MKHWWEQTGLSTGMVAGAVAGRFAIISVEANLPTPLRKGPTAVASAGTWQLKGWAASCNHTVGTVLGK